MIYLGGFYWFTICLKNLPKNDQFFCQKPRFLPFFKNRFVFVFKRKTLLLLGKCPNGLKIGIDVPWGTWTKSVTIFFDFLLCSIFIAPESCWKLHIYITHLILAFVASYDNTSPSTNPILSSQLFSSNITQFRINTHTVNHRINDYILYLQIS